MNRQSRVSTTRHHKRLASVLGILLSLGAADTAGINVVALAAAAERRSTIATTVQVRLTVAPTLPDMAREALTREAAAIWRRYGVTLEWLPGSAARPLGSRELRVLIVSRAGAAASGNEPLALGELCRLTQGQAVAIASIEAAQRAIDRATRPTLARPSDWRNHVLGVALGRVVAHEIGHYLLDTGTHAQRGLMRARFDPRELVDLRPGRFVLDDDAQAWLSHGVGVPSRYAAASEPEGEGSLGGIGTRARFSYKR